jgi:glycosyltransferase involved in cell wall biosynthesis
MMTETKVSVIIPTYNRQQKIGLAIQSVLQQTFTDFELIVVDDASTDGTLDVLDGFKDKRIRVIRHEKNFGEATARNTGVKDARGKYIAFLDSDDEWQPEKLCKQLDAVEGFGDCIVANFSGFQLEDEFNIHRVEIPPVPRSWHKQLLLGCGLGPGTTMLISREAFDKVGIFDASLPRYTDWDWLLRYTKQYPITVVKEPLAVIHRISFPRAKNVELSAMRLLEKHKDEFNASGSYGRRAIGKRYLEISLLYFLEKNKKEGWKWFRKAIAMTWIQRPGMLLRIIDAVLGTSIIPTLIKIRERMLRQSK